jgi:hypothetical protein
MSKEVDEKAAELLALAIKHNRQEYIDALSFLIPVTELARGLAEKPHEFNDSWKKKLLRSEYSKNDIGELLKESLLNNPEYLDFVVEMAGASTSKGEKFHFLEGLMANGRYTHATRCHQALGAEEKEELKTWFQGRLNRLRFANNRVFFYTAGEPIKFDRTAAALFDAIELDMPGNFDGIYTEQGHKLTWSESRFEASVDWVSELSSTEALGSPTVVRQSDGSLAIANGTVLQAFINERTRIESKALGAWHEKSFPLYAPLLTTPEIALELQANGAILVEPEYGQIRHDAYYGRDVHEPSHAFKSTSDPSMDAHEISMSLTLLPYEVINDLRNNPQANKVVLVPHTTSIALLPSAPVSDSLKLAMRYHRPEFLKNRNWSAIYDFHVSGNSTKAYLRGMEINYANNDHLRITSKLLSDTRFVEAIQSPVELSYLRAYFDLTNNRDFKRANLQQVVDGGPIEQQITNLLGNLKILIERLGFTPGIELAGSEEFVRAFANTDLPISELNCCSYWDPNRPGVFMRTADTDAQIRLNAQMGDTGSKFSGFPPEELIAKGTRNKDRLTNLRICGILDRLGVVEVANLAKTPAQRAFVAENFDVRSHLKEIPAAMRKMITGPMLEEALGL